MKNKIIICGSFGASNTGDELILKGILNIFQNEEITVFSEKKLKNIETYPKFPSGIRSIIKFLFSKKENLKALKECNFFILGGGNLFGGPSKKANIIWAIQAIIAVLYKKKLIMFCQSVGDNMGFFIKHLVKFVFQKANMIYLRDKESGKILKEIGVSNKIKILSDPAFTIDFENAKIERTKIIVSLRQMEGLPTSILKEISNFLNNNFNTKKISLLSFETGKENDDILHYRLQKLLFGKSEIKNFNSNPENVLKEFSEAKIAVCMRLHSIIVAIITETPFIAISYAKKIESFLNYAGLSELMIKKESLSLKLLEEKLAIIKTQRTAIIEKMRVFREKSKTLLKEEKII